MIVQNAHLTGVIPALVVALGIYAELIDQRAQSEPNEAPPVLVDHAALGGPLMSFDRRSLRMAAEEAGAPSDLIEGVSDISTTGPSLASLGRDRDMPLLSRDDLVTHFRRAPSRAAGWSSLLERFSPAPGVLQYSPVVRSDEGSMALVVETFMCGTDCGQSRLLLLEEGVGGWTVIAEVPLWVP